MSGFHEVRMKINSLAKFGEVSDLRSPMLVLIDFPCKCSKWSPYLDKLFPIFSKVNSVDLTKNNTIAPHSTRRLTLLAKEADKINFRRGTSFRQQKHNFDIGIYTYHI